MGEPTARAVLRSLVLPIYLPTVLQAIGSTALLPLLPLIALSLGFSVPAASVLAMLGGVVGILGPIPAGRVMSVVGERPAMIGSGIVLVASAVAGFLVSHHGFTTGPTLWHRVGLLAVLLVSATCSQVWLLGRQSYMATQLPVAVRARGMSTLGGMMRVGSVVGPVLGAGVVLLGSEAWVFLLEAAMTAVATVLVAVNLLPADRAPGVRDKVLSRSPIPPDPSPYSPGRLALTTMLLAGVGVVPLTMSRVNRPLILPLVGAALGLDGATISIIFGVAAAVEILLVIPAGTLMDAYGRAAVAVPCLVVSGAGYLLLAGLAPTLGDNSPTSAVWALAASSILIAIGNGLGSGIVMTLGIDLSPERFRTRHIARWNTITSIGRLAGPGLVAAITLVAPTVAAAVATAVLCLVGGAWSARFLPTVTPRPARATRRRSRLEP